MQVILLERVEKLGQMGDIVNVKPGFARNYLLPREKALRATQSNKNIFESRRAQLEGENLKRREEAQGVGEKMQDLHVNLIRQAGEAGHLYGSVNVRDIAAAVSDAGFTINRNQVIQPDPIKSLGMFNVTVRLHPEVTVNVSVNVARSQEEAAIQAATGKALLSSDEEESAALEHEYVFEEDAAEDETPAEADSEIAQTEEESAE